MPKTRSMLVGFALLAAGAANAAAPVPAGQTTYIQQPNFNGEAFLALSGEEHYQYFGYAEQRQALLQQRASQVCNQLIPGTVSDVVPDEYLSWGEPGIEAWSLGSDGQWNSAYYGPVDVPISVGHHRKYFPGVFQRVGCKPAN